MTLNGHYALLQNTSVFRTHHEKNFNEDRATLTLVSDDIRFTQISGGSVERGCETTVRLSTTAIFSTLARYFLRSFKGKIDINIRAAERLIFNRRLIAIKKINRD